MLDHRSRGVFLEGGHPQVAVAVLDELRLDALHLDHFAGQCDFERLGFALAQDRQLDLCLRLAAHLLHGIREGQAFHQAVVELEDQVARLDTGAVGRRILDRRNDLDEAVFHTDFNTESTEFALRADLQILEGICVEVGGVRVEIREHAADRVRDQLLVFNGLDVALLDRIEYFREGAQFLDRQACTGFLLCDCRKLEADQHATDEAGANQPGLFPLTHLSRSNAASFKAYPAKRVLWLPLMTEFKV